MTTVAYGRIALRMVVLTWIAVAVSLVRWDVQPALFVGTASWFALGVIGVGQLLEGGSDG